MGESSKGIIYILAGIRCQERIKRKDAVEDVGLIFEELKRNNCSIDDIQPQCKFFDFLDSGLYYSLYNTDHIIWTMLRVPYHMIHDVHHDVHHI